GKYLYFVASTNLGLSAGGGGGNLSALAHPTSSSAYVMVLKKDLPSPLAPESDDEKPPKPHEKASATPAADEKKDEKKDENKDEKKDDKKEPPKVTIDFERIGQRILALPVPARNYSALLAGKEGILFL